MRLCTSASFVVVIALLASAVVVRCENVTESVGYRKKPNELLFAGYSSLATLLIVKFKMALIAFLVLLGTAATTKFVAGLFHYLGYGCRRRPQKPVYLKYGAPSYDHYQSFDKSYYKGDFGYYRGDAVERAIRSIGGYGD